MSFSSNGSERKKKIAKSIFFIFKTQAFFLIDQNLNLLTIGENQLNMYEIEIFGLNMSKWSGVREILTPVIISVNMHKPVLERNYF